MTNDPTDGSGGEEAHRQEGQGGPGGPGGPAGAKRRRRPRRRGGARDQADQRPQQAKVQQAKAPAEGKPAEAKAPAEGKPAEGKPAQGKSAQDEKAHQGQRARQRGRRGGEPRRREEERQPPPAEGGAAPAGEDGKRQRPRRRRRRGASQLPEQPQPSILAFDTTPTLPRARRSKVEELEPEPPPREVEPYFLASTIIEPDRLATEEPDYERKDGEQLFNIISVRFARSGPVDEYDAGEELYDRGEHVVVETDKGLQLGEVVVASHRAMRNVQHMPRVIRRMTPNDERQEQRNQAKEQQALSLCQKLSSEYRLPMKLIGVDYLHGGNRAIFYFSAEGRIDFRQLVRELATQLHTRIEMRQVGVRDASRHIGGVGPCGQQLCCSRFLDRFAPVSIRMAKDQNLVLNPQKVSGVCGRLMCCLTYEQKGYEQLRKGLPRAGKKIELADGQPAKVRDVDVLRRLLRVQLEDGSFEIVEADSLKPPAEPPSAEEE